MNEQFNCCPDCGVPPGFPHINGCDVERCADCGFQRIGCDHEDDLNTPRILWTGLWPGISECHEFGWYAKLMPGRGWVRCHKDDDDASPDLNRLYIEAIWDKEQARFIRNCQPTVNPSQ